MSGSYSVGFGTTRNRVTAPVIAGTAAATVKSPAKIWPMMISTDPINPSMIAGLALKNTFMYYLPNGQRTVCFHAALSLTVRTDIRDGVLRRGSRVETPTRSLTMLDCH